MKMLKTKELTSDTLRKELRHMISGEAPFLSDGYKQRLLAAALLELLKQVPQNNQIATEL